MHALGCIPPPSGLVLVSRYLTSSLIELAPRYFSRALASPLLADWVATTYHHISSFPAASSLNLAPCLAEAHTSERATRRSETLALSHPSVPKRSTASLRLIHSTLYPQYPPSPPVSGPSPIMQEVGHLSHRGRAMTVTVDAQYCHLSPQVTSRRAHSDHSWTTRAKRYVASSLSATVTDLLKVKTTPSSISTTSQNPLHLVP